MCWYLPKWGLMWASLVRQLMIWMTSFRPLPLVNGMSTASMTAVMTAWIVFGDSYHTASPNEEQGLGWHVRWVSDVLSYIALFWIWTINSCTFSVLQISDLWCFCWRSSRRSLFATAQYNTMQQINHNVTCGNVQHSFCKAPSPDIIQFLMFWTMSSESNLVCNKWILFV